MARVSYLSLAFGRWSLAKQEHFPTNHYGLAPFPTCTGRGASKARAFFDRANPLVADSGDSCGFYRLDGHSRRDLSRAAGLLQRSEQCCSRVFKAQIFLSVYLRILFQPLRYRHPAGNYPFQASLPDWRGYLVSLFALVWVANVYMAGFARLQLDVRHERIEIKSQGLELQSKEEEMKANRAA